MNWRAFALLIAGTAAWPLAVRAQQAERMRRIGMLTNQAENDPEAHNPDRRRSCSDCSSWAGPRAAT